MTQVEAPRAPIQDEHAEWLARQLAANHDRQEALLREIAALQEQLEQAKADEKWLLEVQGATPAAVQAKEPADSATAVEEAAVPRQRQEKPAAKKAAPPAAKKTAAKKTASPAAKKTAPRKTTSAKKTASVAASGASRKPVAASDAKPGSAQAPLRELLLDVMTVRRGEPLKVTEVHAMLKDKHPSRTSSSQVVRNNLEAMTKKGTLERTTQKGSVLYTYPAAPQPEADAASAKVPASA